MKTKKLYIFDADDTLVESWTENLKPGVLEWLREMAMIDEDDRPFLAITTNQGGVGLRYWMVKQGFGQPSKYPNEEQARHLYKSVARRLWTESGCETDLYMCFAYQSKDSGKWGPVPDESLFANEWTTGWRKPNPGMLLAALEWACVDRKDAIMIGDSEDDACAAISAGIDFCWAKDFFREQKDDDLRSD